MAAQRCPHCQRVWPDDRGTDFGGPRDEALLLRPVLGEGIDVMVGGKVICPTTREELQHFLDRVYGPG